MNLDRYPYRVRESFLIFEFESEGPKGVIKKIARFTQMGKNLYNFGFGDLDDDAGTISDKVVSNNGDGNKILVTVAVIICDFANEYRDATIFIKGSTPARTRWYQMNINAFRKEIGLIMNVLGYRNNKWEPFQKGFNYEAFMGNRPPAH